MRPSALIKRRIRWVLNADRPGMHPEGPYDLWTAVFLVECRFIWLWRWRVVAPLRAVLGLPHQVHGPEGWL